MRFLCAPARSHKPKGITSRSKISFTLFGMLERIRHCSKWFCEMCNAVFHPIRRQIVLRATFCCYFILSFFWRIYLMQFCFFALHSFASMSFLFPVISFASASLGHVRAYVCSALHYLLPIQIFAFASLSAYEILSGFLPHLLLLCISHEKQKCEANSRSIKRE